MTDIFIRKAHLSDAPTLAQLAAELGFYAAHGEMENHLSVLLEEPEHLLLVATHNSETDKPIGWLHARIMMSVIMPTLAEVSALIVKERWRHQGVGEQLINEAMTWARRQGVEVFRASGERDNEDSQRFYTHLGFELVGQQNIYELELSPEGI